MGGCVLCSEGEGLRKVSISLPLSTPASYPLAPPGFSLKLLGFPLRKPNDSTTYSQCLVLMPTQTHPFHTSLLSTTTC